MSRLLTSTAFAAGRPNLKEVHQWLLQASDLRRNCEASWPSGVPSGTIPSAFWWVHEQADRGHGGGALEIVANLARTDEEQQRVRDIVRNTLELLWRFFDGLATTPVEQITGKAA